MMRTHHNQNACDGCDVLFVESLPRCSAPTCRVRVCRRCRDELGRCADCVREQANDVAFVAGRFGFTCSPGKTSFVDPADVLCVVGPFPPLLVDDICICIDCKARGPFAAGGRCYDCAGLRDPEAELEDPCPCCRLREPCFCEIGPCRVELLSDDRGTVWGEGRGCATHNCEVA